LFEKLHDIDSINISFFHPYYAGTGNKVEPIVVTTLSLLLLLFIYLFISLLVIGVFS